jgi:hypothetical protein
MSPHEIRTRSAQELYKRWDIARYRLGLPVHATISNPRSQAPPRFFFAPADVPDILALWRRVLPDDVERTVDAADRICRHRFDLLGYEGLDYGQSIDWSLDVVHGKRAPRKAWFKIRFLEFEEVGDVKITWELNRHQHLITLAKAFRATDQERFATELLRQWYDWQEKNPYPIGVNWASSLEVAFRSLSWLWVDYIVAGSRGIPSRFHEVLRSRLALNARHIERYLSTYFAPNTHLLGEAVALFFIGTLCPELPGAERWRRVGWETTIEQARRQVRADGMHFEQTTYYHVYALDFLLHTRVLAALNQIIVPPELDRTLERMLEVLEALARGGAVPRLGDDDGGRVFDPRRNRAEHLLDPLATGAVLFERASFKASARGLREETLWLLGREGAARFDRLPSTPSVARSVAFGDSGIHVMTNADGPPRQLTIDAGPLGTDTGAHGHADALSVQLAFGGREWLSDPGTGVYVDDRGDRDAFRSTRAHNTLEVDGRSQAEPAGPFSWRDLPAGEVERWTSGTAFDLFVGSHTGYRRLDPPVTHRRWVFHLKSRFWLIFDEALGKGTHDLSLHWHFAPGLQVRSVGDVTVASAPDGENVMLRSADTQGWSRSILEGWHSPAYGRKEPCSVLRLASRRTLPARVATLLQPAARHLAETDLLAEVSSGTDAQVSAFRYETGDALHQLFFASAAGLWTLGPWTSDARFVYCGVARNTGDCHLALCDGSSVAAGGEVLLRCAGSASRCDLAERSGPTPEPLAAIVR